MLKFFHRDSPPSGSIHEEATICAVAPFMGVFNNLVLFNQHEKQNRLDLIEPELAESWKWNDDYTRVNFRLRQGVKWHDGKPFTANDVNAPGTCCSASPAKNFVSIHARPGIATSTRSRSMAIPGSLSC
ncbi:MAG: ABC transporter substrate-binding protein [Stellaceae bacterium]